MISKMEFNEKIYDKILSDEPWEFLLEEDKWKNVPEIDKYYLVEREKAGYYNMRTNADDDVKEGSYRYISLDNPLLKNLTTILDKIRHKIGNIHMMDLGGGNGALLHTLLKYSFIDSAINVEYKDDYINYCKNVYPEINVRKKDLLSFSKNDYSGANVFYIYEPLSLRKQIKMFFNSLLKLPNNSIVVTFNNYGFFDLSSFKPTYKMLRLSDNFRIRNEYYEQFNQNLGFDIYHKID